MPAPANILPLTSLIITGGHFGLFYAWVCTTMWGLDNADPRVAMAAMQAMNASVRNMAFAPFFFGAPVVLLLTSIALFAGRQRQAALLFGLAGIVVGLFSVVLTMAVNVPMNLALAAREVPAEIETAQAIWDDYSPTWQFWNQLRTAASGLGLLLVGIGFTRINAG